MERFEGMDLYAVCAALRDITGRIHVATPTPENPKALALCMVDDSGQLVPVIAPTRGHKALAEKAAIYATGYEHGRGDTN